VAKIIPNQNSWIGFTLTQPAGYTASAAIAGSAVSVTEAELDAATNLTPLTVSLQASSTGNAIPTPALDSLFDRSIIGTVQGQFQGDFYRDSVSGSDLAWTNLGRGVTGYVLVSRFGGTGTNKVPRSGNAVEVWPVGITARSASQMTSNTVQTFTCMGALLDPPAENGIVTSSAGVPSTVINASAFKEANGIAMLDWTTPLYLGTTGVLNASTPYKVYQTTAGGNASQISSGASATATGSSAATTITTSAIASGTIAVGQIVSGTGIGTNAVVTAVSGTSPALTVTLSVANSGAVSGTITFGSVALTSSVTVTGTTARISSGLTTGQAYYFAVEAVNAAGTSGSRTVVGPLTV